MGATARRLLNDPQGFVEQELTIVALHMGLDFCVRLIDGYPGRDYADPIAREDLPMDSTRLHDLRAVTARMRNMVLHLGDKTAEAFEGSGVIVRATSEPDEVTFSVTDATKRHVDKLTRSEINQILDRLAPWPKRHFERLVLAEAPFQ